MKKIVIASDSFKGSVSSIEVAQIAETAVHNIFPECEVLKIPVADGGEGTVDVLVSVMNGNIISCRVKGPLMEPVLARYGIIEDEKTAVIEMASASGLTLVPVEKQNPMLTSTYGTGELIKDALLRGCTNFLVGIGGSATNDAGTGMLQALGFRFLDNKGKELGGGGKILTRICSIDDSKVVPEVKQAKFTVACDVNNPFSGIDGAAYVYARQKGADEQMIHDLDIGLKNFAEVIKNQKNKDIDSVPGAGAAGGIGGGFLAFLNANLKPGIEMVLDCIGFDSLIFGADLIITGEGKLDKQTGMGKVPAGVLIAAKKKEIPVIAIGGCIEEIEDLNNAGFLAVLSLLPYPVTLRQAMNKEFTLENIKRTLEQQFRVIQQFQIK
ncbi:glycerate kinase [Gramella sp. AN32]|uniref:glycerate kinase family protein n=1 Tax=Christiangramia TaxID=292691 RepID=UPI0020436958|nr:glycerate kinase [Gramella sp. AN32]